MSANENANDNAFFRFRTNFKNEPIDYHAWYSRFTLSPEEYLGEKAQRIRREMKDEIKVTTAVPDYGSAQVIADFFQQENTADIARDINPNTGFISDDISPEEIEKMFARKGL